MAHTITSAIVGVGLVTGWKAIRWSLVAEIAASWVLTLPATVLFGYLYATVFGFFL